MPTDTPLLETPRLLLRPPRRDDFEAWAAFVADEEAARHLGGPQPRSVAWRTFLTMVGAWHVQGFAMFSVLDKTTGRWLGRVGPWFPEGWPGTEIGWGIVRDCWGRGYAGEAADAAIEWAFAALGWSEVIHVIDIGNTASQAVARKLGSGNRGGGRLPAPYQDAAVEIWGQTRREWQTRAALTASPGNA